MCGTTLYIMAEQVAVGFQCPEQHCFLQHRSCKSQLILTVHDLAMTLNKRLQTDVIIMDLRDFC